LAKIATDKANKGDLGMIKRNEEFRNIDALMSRFGGRVNRGQPQTRGYTKGGHKVHVLIIGNQRMLAKGV
jgi:hypothetical protein